jgi:hypothetical protein
LGPIGKWLFSIREAQEFAEVARHFEVPEACIASIDQRLLRSWRFLVSYRQLSGLSSIRAKARRRRLTQSMWIVESLLMEYTATYASQRVWDHFKVRVSRWGAWRAANAGMVMLTLILCVAIPFLSHIPEWRGNIFVANLAWIAMFSQICYFALTWLSVKYVYSTNCCTLLSLVSVIYRKESLNYE